MSKGRHDFSLLALLTAGVCLLSAYSPLSAQVRRGPHRHVKLSGSVLEEASAELTIVEVSPDASLEKENLVVNRRKTYTAYTAYHPGEQPAYRIYFEEKRTGKVYEIRGLPLAHRPFSDLVWTDNRTLVFDRWSQPHYGVHYAVDVRKKKLIVAAAFPDKFFLEQQRPRRR
jgi:hypothetical protein